MNEPRKILLVSPSSDDDFLSQSIHDVHYLQAEAFFAPHAITAVAALTPEGYDVHIHDEQLHGPVIPLLARESFDIVGISLIATQLDRVRTIALAFRKMGSPGRLVVGGIGAAYMYSQLRDLVDHVFFGEAEVTWPEFLEDFERGETKPIYQKASRPNLELAPPPDWSLIAHDIPRYSTGSVQTTRGCHFDCAFCDVIYTFGRTPRFKTTEQILTEIKALKDLDVRMIYFADDNFCADRKRTKRLLRQLVEINNSFEEPIGFLTQVDITIAKDEEMLELLADCNFNELQIGIESNDPASLGDLNKQANVTVDLAEAIRKIQSYGMVVMAHMIVGADSDGPEAFQRTLDFINEAGILHHLCHPLAAPPGTKLWYQLKREGRLIAPLEESTDFNEIGTGVDSITNIVPKKMSRIELLEGMANYFEQAFDLDEHHQRVLRFIEGIQRVPQVRPMGPSVYWKYRKMMTEMFSHHLLRVSAPHRHVFFDIMRRAAQRDPDLVPRAIFAHTNFVMERGRSRGATQRARLQADWERRNPDKLQTLPRETPLPEAVRNQARQIFEPAYFHIRRHIADRETMFRTILDAMTDYTDRFGAELDDVDEQQLLFIRESCDRAIASQGNCSTSSADELPEDRLPRGFVRDVLDNLDRSIRLEAK